MLTQVNIPLELNQKLKRFKVMKDMKTIDEAIVYLVNKQLANITYTMVGEDVQGGSQ